MESVGFCLRVSRAFVKGSSGALACFSLSPCQEHLNNTGSCIICIARYPKRQSALCLFLALFFFFCLLLQKIHICCASALIYFSRQMDLTRTRRFQFLRSYVHKPRTRRPRAQAKNRFEHTVLSFELICMTLSARADSVPVSEGAVERRTIMLLSVKRRSPLPDIKMFVSSFCVTLRFARRPTP